MASAELSRRVEKVVGYPPLSEMGDQQRGIRFGQERLAELESADNPRVEAVVATTTMISPLHAQLAEWERLLRGENRRLLKAAGDRHAEERRRACRANDAAQQSASDLDENGLGLALASR